MKLIKNLKEMLNTGLSSQEMIVIILMGGFAFLIQAASSHGSSLVVGYLIYVSLGVLSFMFMKWNKKNGINKKN